MTIRESFPRQYIYIYIYGADSGKEGQCCGQFVFMFVSCKHETWQRKESNGSQERNFILLDTENHEKLIYKIVENGFYGK